MVPRFRWQDHAARTFPGGGRRQTKPRPRTAKNSSVARTRSTTLIPKTRTGFLVYRSPGTSIVAAAFNNILVNHVFRANSMYDPDWTLIGHQPYLYDQYSALYESSKVLSSSIEVKFHNPTDQPCIVGIYLKSFSDAAVTSVDKVAEMPRCTWRMSPGKGAGDRSITTLRLGYNAKRFYGLAHGASDDKNDVLSKWNKTGTSVFTAIEAQFVVFTFWPSYATASAATIGIETAISFHSKFINPIIPDSS